MACSCAIVWSALHVVGRCGIVNSDGDHHLSIDALEAALVGTPLLISLTTSSIVEVSGSTVNFKGGR